ncbi:zinc finger protein 8-like [Synchiropus splendidus]|uniref:zinc finger protein 8-like n=1 Tax=Synchiropus splendidus TaxID=270530 RepID=UPI00237D47E7|nr:zinc finger protein 8-like [Synchiropus splendidus]
METMMEQAPLELHFSPESPTGSSVQNLRRFVSDRLAAAAQEILGMFEQTITALEQEVDRQRRLLDVVRRPVVVLNKIDPEISRHSKAIAGLGPPLLDAFQPLEVGQESSVIKEEQEDLCVRLPEDRLLTLEDLSGLDQTGETGPPAHVSQETNKPKRHVCCTCGKSFSARCNLNVHKRVHTGEKPHECNVCGKRFGQKSVLVTHLRLHTDEKPFQCQLCGKCFRQRTALTVHLRVHSNDRPFFCRACGQTFFQKSDLTIHLRRHTGERPYQCQTCDKSFTTKSILYSHMRTHR